MPFSLSRWFGLGVLSGLVLLGLSAAAQSPTIRWNYIPAAPEQFVVRRSLDGATWQDVAVLPGASGTGLRWEDTTLPESADPITARYLVYAVHNGIWSEASNMALIVV